MLKNILIVVGLLLVLLVVVSGFVIKSYAPKIDIPEQLDPSELQAYIAKVVEDNNLPAMAVAVIDSSGIRHLATAGLRKLKGTEKVTDQDVFHLGSCTKAMTSTLVAKLIDEGLLSWDTKLIDVYTDITSDIHSDFHDITIHELLTHTAGLYPNPSNMWGYTEQEIKARRLSIIKEALQDSSKHKRGDFLYSNLGYIIAGSMIEKLTDKSWEELMQSKIFDPLVMTSAGFGIPGTIDEEDQPWGHNNLFGIGEFNPVQGDNPASLGPAGTVHANLEDWGKFISFLLLQNNTNSISSAQKTKLLQPVKDNYACGWVAVERSWSDGTVYWHNGSNTMNYALTWVAPSNNRAYLVCTNSYDPKSEKICDSMIGALMKVDEPKE